MKYLKQLTISLIVIGLMGCATTNKPLLSEEQYESFANTDYGLSKCVEFGKVPQDVAAQGRMLLQQKLSGYFYFPERLNGFIEFKRKYGTPPSDSDCIDVVATIQTYSVKNNTYNQGTQYNQPFKVDAPKHTVCNRIGTQTICTTY